MPALRRAKAVLRAFSKRHVQPCASHETLMRVLSTAERPQPEGRAAYSNSHEELKSRSQLGNTGVDEAEIEKFSAMAASWWDTSGPMAPLHTMNPIRTKFIRQALCRQFQKEDFDPQPFAGLRIADVGSGAGILSESLARLGARVTGIDASRDAIEAAKTHAAADKSIYSSLQYRQGTAEALVSEGLKFDAVVASEIIEHVPNPEEFCRALAELAGSKGAVVISTLNRTPRSYALAILAAERLLGVLPAGTHDWSNFITPDELVMLMQYQGMRLQDISGMTFALLTRRWTLTDDLGVNYIATFIQR